MDELWEAAKICRVARVMQPLHGIHGSRQLTSKKPADMPASIRQRLLDLAKETKQDFGLILTK